MQIKIDNDQQKNFNDSIFIDDQIYNKNHIGIFFENCLLRSIKFLNTKNLKICGVITYMYNCDIIDCEISEFSWISSNFQRLKLFNTCISNFHVGNILTFLSSINWMNLSQKNIAIAMAIDAQYHGNIDTFDKWANGYGNCPYTNVNFQRVLQFREDSSLWDRSLVNKKFNVMNLLKDFLKDHNCVINFG